MKSYSLLTLLVFGTWKLDFAEHCGPWTKYVRPELTEENILHITNGRSLTGTQPHLRWYEILEEEVVAVWSIHDVGSVLRIRIESIVINSMTLHCELQASSTGVHSQHICPERYQHFQLSRYADLIPKSRPLRVALLRGRCHIKSFLNLLEVETRGSIPPSLIISGNSTPKNPSVLSDDKLGV